MISIKLIRPLPYICVTCVASLIIGCGGGGGGSSSSGSGSTSSTAGSVSANLQAGVTAINTAATTPGSTQTSVATALTAFTAANAAVTSATPAGTRAQANVGYALASAAAAAYQIQNSLGVTVLRSATTSSTPIQNAVSRLAYFNGALFPSQKISTVGEVLPLSWVASLQSSSFRSIRGNVTAAQVTAALKQLYTAGSSPGTSTGILANVITSLSDANVTALEANPFVFQYVNSSGQKQTVKFGTVEAYGLRAAAETIASFIDLALAYNFDPGTFNFNAPAFPNAGAGTASPSTYFPASPFGTLNSNGGALTKDELAQLSNAAQDISSGLTAYNSRSTTGWIANVLINPSELPTYETASAQLLNLVNTTGTFNIIVGNGSNTSAEAVAITPFLNNPPANLTAFFATLNSDGTTVTEQQGSIADPTFDGVFTPGIPSSILYDNTSTSVSLNNAQAAELAGIFNNQSLGF